MPKKVCIRLSPQMRRSLKRRYQVEKQPKMKERLQMVLQFDHGKAIKEVAEIVSKTTRTVSTILHTYQQAGLKAIELKPQPGNHRKLTKEQRKQVAALLKHRPAYSEIASPFWSVQAVRTLVKQQFSVIYADNDSYHALLYESGFSFHRTDKKYRQQNQAMVKQWLNNTQKN